MLILIIDVKELARTFSPSPSDSAAELAERRVRVTRSKRHAANMRRGKCRDGGAGRVHQSNRTEISKTTGAVNDSTYQARRRGSANRGEADLLNGHTYRFNRRRPTHRRVTATRTTRTPGRAPRSPIVLADSSVLLLACRSRGSHPGRSSNWPSQCWRWHRPNRQPPRARVTACWMPLPPRFERGRAARSMAAPTTIQPFRAAGVTTCRSFGASPGDGICAAATDKLCDCEVGARNATIDV
jgi:hypothetical protein